MGAWGGFEIAGDAGDAEDVAVVAGADRVFASEAPAAAAVRVEVEVETVEDGAAFADDAFVLLAVMACEGGGEEIGGDAAGEVVGVAAAAASGEGAVDVDVAAGAVFDEEDDVRDIVEEACDGDGGVAAVEEEDGVEGGIW